MKIPYQLYLSPGVLFFKMDFWPQITTEKTHKKLVLVCFLRGTLIYFQNFHSLTVKKWNWDNLVNFFTISFLGLWIFKIKSKKSNLIEKLWFFSVWSWAKIRFFNFFDLFLMELSEIFIFHTHIKKFGENLSYCL